VNALQPAGVDKGFDVLNKRLLIVATFGHLGSAVPASGECENSKVVSQVLPEGMIDPSGVAWTSQQQDRIAASSEV
jgi:hypothetical protein